MSFTCALRDGSTDFSCCSIVIDDFGNNWPPGVDYFNANAGMFFISANFMIKEIDDGIKRASIQMAENYSSSLTTTLTFFRLSLLDCKEMVFCFWNWPDFLWEKNCSSDKEKHLKFKSENVEIYRTIFETKCLFNLFLEVSQI